MYNEWNTKCISQLFEWVKELNLRVWSWLRTNAGGMPNTCKSNGISLVVAILSNLFSGERVSNTWATCLLHRDNSRKRLLIPDKTTPRHLGGVKAFSGKRWARVPLASWWDNSPPRRRWVADLREWSATLELRHGPDSFGRQQWGILGNGGNSYPAMPREWRRPSGCKVLLLMIKKVILVNE